MAQDRLFYGAIDNATIFANGSNSFIRIRFDADTTSTTLTNVVDVSGYFGLSNIIPGQQLVASGQFPSGTTVVSVDVGASEIVVSDNPDASGTNRLGRVSPPKGQYFVNSGSLTTPQNNPTDFFDITGSEDTQYDSTQNKFGVLLLQASTASLSSTISGEFAQYEISRVVDRQNTAQASFYITSSATGILSEEPDKAVASGITSFAIVELSYSSSLATIFNQNVASTPAGGYEVAAYQIAVQEFLDDLSLDVLYTGSYAKGNTQFINFTGSGIQDITVTESFGKTGVNVIIQGGGGSSGDDDWYIGSTFLTASKDVRITGSLLVTHTASNLDFFTITSASYEAFKVNSEGITQFFAHTDAPEPWATAEYGGLYFQSSSVWAALD
jgi:hypothetical protein